jgi:hypothetical protein
MVMLLKERKKLKKNLLKIRIICTAGYQNNKKLCCDYFFNIIAESKSTADGLQNLKEGEYEF